MSVMRSRLPMCPANRLRSRCAVPAPGVVRLLAFAGAAALAGCSADITRFDSSSFSLAENGKQPVLASSQRRNAGAPVFDDAPSPYARQAPGLGVAERPAAAPPAPTTIAALPDTERPLPHPGQSSPPLPRIVAGSRPLAGATPPPRAVAKGEAIEVQQGDTLYGIAKRHGVLISEIMSASDLKNPNIKPGQTLYLPTHAKGTKVPVAPRAKPAVGNGDQVASALAPTPAAAPATPATDWAGSYTVKPGDSLYTIAARQRTTFAELQRVNGIADVRKVRPGTVLKVPGEAATAAPPAAPAVPDRSGQQAERGTRVAANETASAIERQDVGGSAPAGVTVLNDKLAAVSPRPTAAEPTPAPKPSADTGTSAGPLKLRWPVKGRIVQGFGQRADGTHNDGIDVAVPAGTEVLAAEAGVVAYAGGEVKTYGNLVLIRHDNGWITAYAYNDQVLVQRGDRVKRGQVVAKAGKSGPVDQPQLHFEVRVGAKPVDPAPYLDKL